MQRLCAWMLMATVQVNVSDFTANEAAVGFYPQRRCCLEGSSAVRSGEDNAPSLGIDPVLFSLNMRLRSRSPVWVKRCRSR